MLDRQHAGSGALMLRDLIYVPLTSLEAEPTFS